MPLTSVSHHAAGSIVLIAIVATLGGLSLGCLTAAANSMPIPVAALGGAAAGLQGGLSVMQTNPSGLAALPQQEAGIQIVQRGDYRAVTAGYLQPSQNGFSGGLYWTGVSSAHTLSYQDIGYVVAAGPWNGISVGGALRKLHSGSSGTVNGWSSDVGLQLETMGLRMGASARNAQIRGTGVTREHFPLELRTGVALDWRTGGVAVDVTSTGGSGAQTLAGGAWVKIRQVRLGLGASRTSKGSVGWGGGVVISLSGIQVELALQNANNQDRSLHGSLSYRF